jgi:hypothetical protein
MRDRPLGSIVLSDRTGFLPARQAMNRGPGAIDRDEHGAVPRAKHAVSEAEEPMVRPGARACPAARRSSFGV